MMEWLRIVYAVYVGLFLFGLAGFAVWFSIFTDVTPTTTRTGRLLWHAGRIIVILGLIVLGGLVLGAAVAGFLAIFRIGS